MIVSPIPGQTPDRSSEHTLQGLASNLNAYAEEFTPVVTAGTSVVLTPAQVIQKNLRLEPGASGAFTLTLPPTSKIIDALGATFSIDGSYWFPFYVFNHGVGQTATLTTGDANTTVDPVNATVADGHISKWMVNVQQAANASVPMTLYFHLCFTACCAAVGGNDLPPLLLQFGTPEFGSADANTVLLYDITAPGTVFGRSKDAAQLGTGGTTYAPKTFDSSAPSAIYNPADDKMYFLAQKTAPGPVVTHVLVQFDPRALVISGEMALPTGFTATNSTLIDVADTWAWITSSSDGSTRAFDLIAFVEMFNDATALSTLAGVVTAGIACAAGQLILPDANTASTIHLITVVSTSTFLDTPISLPAASPVFANDGPSRRRWISDRNKVVLSDNGGTARILDLNNLSAQLGYVDGSDVIAAGVGPFWDFYLHRLIGNTAGPDFGMLVGDDTGAVLGIAGKNNADWQINKNPTLGGKVLADSLTITALGAFDETIISTTPSEIYETNDSFITPGGNQIANDNLCVAMRRKAGFVFPVPQQGGALPIGVATGTFTTSDPFTVTVVNGSIVSIV